MTLSLSQNKKEVAMIKAVYFDVGGVITSGMFEPSFREGIKKYGMDYTEEMERCRRRFRDMAEKGEISDDEYWKGFVNEAGLPGSVEYWKSTFKGHKIIPGVITIVRELKSKGILLGIISNRRREHVLGDQEMEFYPLFDVVVYSYEIGIIKPDERIYKIALERVNVSAIESLFIDDKEENVRAAQALGMDGIVFQSADQLREELTKRHLL